MSHPQRPVSGRFQPRKLPMALRTQTSGMRPLSQLWARALAIIPVPALDRLARLRAFWMEYYRAAPRTDINFWPLGTLAVEILRTWNSSVARPRLLTTARGQRTTAW